MTNHYVKYEDFVINSFQDNQRKPCGLPIYATVEIFACRKVKEFKIPDILCEDILMNCARVEVNDRLVVIYARGNLSDFLQFFQVPDLTTYTV
jgi:hypothetical protein